MSDTITRTRPAPTRVGPREFTTRQHHGMRETPLPAYVDLDDVRRQHLADEQSYRDRVVTSPWGKT